MYLNVEMIALPRIMKDSALHVRAAGVILPTLVDFIRNGLRIIITPRTDIDRTQRTISVEIILMTPLAPGLGYHHTILSDQKIKDIKYALAGHGIADAEEDVESFESQRAGLDHRVLRLTSIQSR